MVPDILNEKLEQSDDNEINDLYEKPQAHEINSNENSETYQSSKLSAAKGNCCWNCFPSKNYQRQKFAAKSFFFEVQ